MPALAQTTSIPPNESTTSFAIAAQDAGSHIGPDTDHAADERIEISDRIADDRACGDRHIGAGRAKTPAMPHVFASCRGRLEARRTKIEQVNRCCAQLFWAAKSGRCGQVRSVEYRSASRAVFGARVRADQRRVGVGSTTRSRRSA